MVNIQYCASEQLSVPVPLVSQYCASVQLTVPVPLVTQYCASVQLSVPVPLVSFCLDKLSSTLGQHSAGTFSCRKAEKNN